MEARLSTEGIPMTPAFDPAKDIRLIREPTVYLVGRQTVDQTVIDRFLADHGVSWQTDTEVAGEHLVEVAGRLCYLSFARPRPGGNQAYLSHILEVGHGSVLEHAVWNLVFVGLSRSCTHELVRHRAGWGYCLTGDTLVYSDHFIHGVRDGVTKRSLKRLHEMTKTPHGRSRLTLLRLRCFDEQSGTFTTGKVAQIAYSGARPVFRVMLEGGKSITCSRDHRFLTPGGWLPLHEIVNGLAVSPGGLAVHGPLQMPIATNGIPAYKDREWLQRHYVEQGMDQEAIGRLAGVSGHTIRSWVRKHGLQKPGGSWSKGRSPWNKGKHYHGGWELTPETRRLLGDMKRGPNNPHWKGGSSRFGVKVRRGVKVLVPEVLRRHDFTCRMCGRRGSHLTMHHVLPIWARPDLALDANNLVPLCGPCHLRVNGHELDYAEQFGAPPSEGRVIDQAARPRGGGQILTCRFRQIRSVSFAGEQDTYDIEMEGPHANFVANGIVTHNSQLSQRYVDESVAEYVEPDSFANDPELHRIWLDAIAQSHQAYMTLTARLQEKFKDEPDKTLRRKLARQAARSVLPNATETKIFVTANARALRHFIELRASRHAETEIRKLAVKVLQLLQQEAPHLFGDYELVPLPDGTMEAVTSHRKV
jgi:thymidylate synthase ThyX